MPPPPAHGGGGCDKDDDDDDDDDDEGGRASLLAQIERERREVRILEAELGLLVAEGRRRAAGRKRRREEEGGGGGGGRIAGAAAGADAGPGDLLDVLDALQCRVTLEQSVVATATAAAAGRGGGGGEAEGSPRSLPFPGGGGGSDAATFRLHPLLGGVTFTGVAGPLRGPGGDADADADAGDSDNRNAPRQYVLSGYVGSGGAASPPGARDEHRIAFEVRPEVSFGGEEGGGGGGGGEATVTSVTATFAPSPAPGGGGDGDDGDGLPAAAGRSFPASELSELAGMAEVTLNLTQLFRELVAFGAFHARRVEALERLVEAHGTGTIVMETAEAFRITSGGDCGTGGGTGGGGGPSLPRFYMRLAWRRRFSEVGREDELVVLDVGGGSGGDDDDDDDGRQSLRSLLLDPSGVRSLASSLGGCEEAIEALVSAASGGGSEVGGSKGLPPLTN